MMPLIKEQTVEEIENKLATMNTDLNKLSYLEIAMKEPSLNHEIKRFILEEASNLYESRKMYEKAGKAIDAVPRMGFSYHRSLPNP